MPSLSKPLDLPWIRAAAHHARQLTGALAPEMLPPLALRSQLLLALLAAAIGLCFGGVRLTLHPPTNDLWLAYGSAQLLWQGQNPYAYPTDGWPSNPLTAVLAIAPFTGLSLELVGAGLVALSTALLVFGALRTGQPLRLWALASWPYLYNLLYAQWAILFLAMLLLPGLVWLAPLKPQLGLSVFLSRFSMRQALFAALFVLASLLLYPSWPAFWLAQVGGYDGFVPIAFFPLLLLVPLIVWRRGLGSHRVLFFVLFCLSPQRLWHDQLLLWYLPRRGWQIALLTASSWLILLLVPATSIDWSWLALIGLFLPCALFVLFERDEAEG